MLRNILRLIWLLLTLWLIIWAGEALLSTDQRSSMLPFNGDGSGRAAIWIGVAWGILPTLGIFASRGTSARRARADDQIAVGSIVAMDATGTTINEVPQYDVYVRVSPAVGSDFIGRLTMRITPDEQSSLIVGAPLPVRYSSTNADALSLADPIDPAVREALLQRRIDGETVA